MSEWTYPETQKEEEYCRLEYYGFKRQQESGPVEFRITLREYVNPRDPMMTFYAETDKQTNQKTAAFTPVGWGRTRLDALSACVKSIRRFPYEGE